MNDPFIHLIKTKYGFYCFDVNTNSILKISRESYEYLNRDYQCESAANIPDNEMPEEINDIIEKGYLSNVRPEKIEMQETNIIPYYLNNRLEKLTLQVTQQCNFCCSYCPYSLGDDSYYHTHNSKHMTWEVAKKAIDFFIKRTRDTSVINFGFYGGEPLLQYDLIKKCIIYIKEQLEGRNVTFTMTTNGSLLTSERIKFLIDNNVAITVSFDGPREIQNKNRKHKSDGSGTFDDVYNKLMEIKKENPDYYKKIAFNCVVDPANDCGKINQFFSCDVFKDKSIQTPLVYPINERRLYYSEKFIDNYKFDTVAAMLAKAEIVPLSKLTVLAKNTYYALEWFEKGLSPKLELPRKIGHSGPCKPGIMRLFVTCDGSFYPCEKIDDCSQLLKIGSIADGLNEERIKNIYNLFHVNDNRCRNCWNLLHCNICARSVVYDNKVSEKLYKTACDESCNSTEKNMKKIIAIREAKHILKSVEV